MRDDRPPSLEMKRYLQSLQDLIYENRLTENFVHDDPRKDLRRMRELKADLAYYEQKYASYLADRKIARDLDDFFGNGRHISNWDRNTQLKQDSEAKRLRTKNVDQMRIEEIEQKYTLPSTRGFFPDLNVNSNYSKNSFVIFDTETDDKGRILTISAQKMRYDYSKQQLVRDNVLKQSFHRVYAPSDADVRETESVHKLNLPILRAMRSKLKANYSLSWNEQQRKQFLDWVGSSVLVGHNIEEADIPWLYGKGKDSKWSGYKGSFIDTLHLARGFWKGQKNDLENLSERLGVPFESIKGLQHHDVFSDVVVTAKVFEQMIKNKASVRRGIDLEGRFQTMPYDYRRNLNEASGFFKKVGGGYIMGNDFSSAELDDLADNILYGHGYDRDGNNTGFGYADEEVKDMYMRDRIGGALSASDSSMRARDIALKFLRWHVKNGVGREESIDAIYAQKLGLGREIIGAMYDAMDIAPTAKAPRTDQNAAFASQKLARAAEQREWANAWREPWTRQEELATSQAFSRGLQMRLTKEQYLNGADSNFLTSAQQDKFSARAAYMGESIEEYSDAVDEAIKKNKQLTDIMHGLYRASGGLYDPNRITQAAISGIGEVGGAVGGLLPSWARPAEKRFVQGISQISESLLKQNQYAWNTAKYLGGMATTAGGAMMASGVGFVPGAVLAGAGALVSVGSQIAGSHATMKVESATKEFAGKINLLSAGVQLALAPLRLFSSGLRSSISLFTRLGSIWGQNLGLPLTHLTSIGTNNYLRMYGTDSLMGFKAGTTNEAHNNLAYGQAGLYTSGQFDTQRLVAAARLGIFSDVYAPMGGNTEEQMASYTNKLANDLRVAKANGDKRREQEIMYFAKLISPELPTTLQTMNTLGVHDYTSLQNGSYWRGRGIHEAGGSRNLVAWQETAGEYNYAMQQFNYALHNAATPLWSRYGKPIMNTVNDSIDKIAGGANVWETVFSAGKEIWDILDLPTLGAKLKDVLLDGWVKFSKEVQDRGDLVNVFTDAISKIFDYLNATTIKIDPFKLIKGDPNAVTFKTPQAKLADAQDLYEEDFNTIGGRLDEGEYNVMNEWEAKVFNKSRIAKKLGISVKAGAPRGLENYLNRLDAKGDANTWVVNNQFGGKDWYVGKETVSTEMLNEFAGNYKNFAGGFAEEVTSALKGFVDGIALPQAKIVVEAQAGTEIKKVNTNDINTVVTWNEMNARLSAYRALKSAGGL